MKKTLLFYIYSSTLFVMAASYIVIFLNMPLTAIYQNGITPSDPILIPILQFASIPILIISVFTAIAMPIFITTYHIVNSRPFDNNDLLISIIVGIIFVGTVYFSGAYPQTEDELNSIGYQKVLEMASQSDTTQALYEKLEKNGILTIGDFDLLIDTFYEDMRSLRHERESVEEVKKEQAKNILLKSKYSRLGSPTDINLTKREY